MTERALEPGMELTPVLRLTRPLSSGGMGHIWLAEHKTLKCSVVVKLIAEELASDPVMLARFSREAAAAAQVRSPHVVQILDHGLSNDGVPYIAMELLEGCNLGQYVRQRGRLPLGEVARIVSQVARALGRAHAAGIIHRDIKPPNIFLCELGGGDKFVKLLDFGIAKKELATGEVDGGGDELTKTEALLGTPHYASPEQIMSAKRIDARSDLWSLGVVAYYCLTGVRPFEGAGIGAISVAVCKGEHVPPSAREPSLPRAFDAWFAKACALLPQDRFQTVEEMAESLVALASGAALSSAEAAAAGREPAAQPASEAQPAHVGLEPSDRARRSANLRRALVAGALLGGIGLIVALRLVPRGASPDASPDVTRVATPVATTSARPIESSAPIAAPGSAAAPTTEGPSALPSATAPVAAKAPTTASAAPPAAASSPTTTPPAATARAWPKATAPKKYADDI